MTAYIHHYDHQKSSIFLQSKKKKKKKISDESKASNLLTPHIPYKTLELYLFAGENIF